MELQVKEWRSTFEQASSSFDQYITRSSIDIAEQFLSWS
jgi:hypothetical protein